MMRIFIGIALSDEEKTDIQKRMRSVLPDLSNGRWIKPENWHITLCFLGDIDGLTLEHVKSVVRDVATNVQPFTVNLRDIALFPDHPSRLLAANVTGEMLQDLFLQLNQRTADMGGQAACLPFRPHMTVLKSKEPLSYFTPITLNVLLPVNALVIFESQKIGDEREYRIVQQFLLDKR